MMMSGRAQTAIDRIAEAYLDDSVALDPVAATRAGILGHDHRLPDLHPAWHEECSQLRRRTLEALAAAEPADANDRITAAALGEQLRAVPPRARRSTSSLSAAGCSTSDRSASTCCEAQSSTSAGLPATGPSL